MSAKEDVEDDRMARPLGTRDLRRSNDVFFSLFDEFEDNDAFSLAEGDVEHVKDVEPFERSYSLASSLAAATAFALPVMRDAASTPLA